MRGRVKFMELLRQYGMSELVDPLEVFGKIANLPEDATEHVVHQAVTYAGSRSAAAFWRFLRDLPGAVGASSPAEFVVGYEPLVESEDEALEQWDSWLGVFYQMAMESVPPNQGDGSSIKVRDRFLTLIYDELDSFLFPRIRFWLKEQKAKEDTEYVGRRGRVVEEL
jgi:hypothetical protein